MDYFLQIPIMVCIYAMLGLAFNIIWGVTGLLSLAHAALYGLGAYVTAFLSIKLGWGVELCLFFSIILGSAVGSLIAFPALKLNSDYFVIATFSLQALILGVANAWTEVTGGPIGLYGIPALSIFGWTVESSYEFLIIVTISYILVQVVTGRILVSPFGRVLKSIREDSVFVESTGRNALIYKIKMNAVAGGISSFAGVFYAFNTSIVTPSAFSIMEAVLVISIVTIGGAGSKYGPVVGAIILVTLPEIFLFIGIPSDYGANLRQILYGAALIIFLIWRPQGILENRSFIESGK